MKKVLLVLIMLSALTIKAQTFRVSQESNGSLRVENLLNNSVDIYAPLRKDYLQLDDDKITIYARNKTVISKMLFSEIEVSGVIYSTALETFNALELFFLSSSSGGVNQTLSINSDSLSISGGNTVVIPSGGSNVEFDFNDYLLINDSIDLGIMKLPFAGVLKYDSNMVFMNGQFDATPIGKDQYQMNYGYVNLSNFGFSGYEVMRNNRLVVIVGTNDDFTIQSGMEVNHNKSQESVEMFSRSSSTPAGCVLNVDTGDISLSKRKLNGSLVEAKVNSNGVIFPPLTTEPTGEDGAIYYNSSLNRLKVNENNEWLNLTQPMGWYDYNDSTTSVTPINALSGVSEYLTNDGRGDFSNKLFPYDGVVDVWDESTNSFDFSSLPLGSTVDIRLDLELTTDDPNQEVETFLEMSIGLSPFDVFWSDRVYKNAETHKYTVSSFVYIGSAEVRDNPAKFKILSDGDLDIKVNGFVCRVIRY